MTPEQLVEKMVEVYRNDDEEELTAIAMPKLTPKLKKLPNWNRIAIRKYGKCYAILTPIQQYAVRRSQ